LNTLTAVIVAAMASVFFVYTIGITEFVPIFGRGVLPVAMGLFAIWAPFWRWLLTRMRQKSVNTLKWLVIAEGEVFEVFNKDNAAKFPYMQFTRLDADGQAETFDRWLRDNPQRSGLVFENNAPLQPDLTKQMMNLRLEGMPILTMSEFYEQYWLKLPVLHLQDGWFIQSRGFNLIHDYVGLRLKRLLDLFIAIAGLVFLSPLLLLIALLVRITSPGKALYRQKRVGRSGKVFSLYKFRTMVSDAEADGARWTEQNDPRITPLGKVLRVTRIDELPQLWNLGRGDMSLIGPRPERPEFVERLEREIPYYDLRHLVPPGITGWAQVMYRYGSSVEDARNKLEYDLYYIKNHSIQLDLAIVIKTILVVVKGMGR
jgi:exopolysaccharide biosynthesis polyprenyl glycosylphosphotransferase